MFPNVSDRFTVIAIHLSDMLSESTYIIHEKDFLKLQLSLPLAVVNYSPEMLDLATDIPPDYFQSLTFTATATAIVVGRYVDLVPYRAAVGYGSYWPAIITCHTVQPANG